MAAAAQMAAAPVTAAAARALDWLSGAWEAREDEDPRLAVEALALSALCRLLCGSAGGAADQVDRAIGRAIAEPAWAASSLPGSLVAAVGALRQRNGFAASAGRYLEALGALSADELDGAGRSGESNGVLLRLALYGVAPSPPRAPAGLHRLRGSAGEVRRFASEVEACSAFGTAAVADEPAATLLEGAAIAAFRVYDLPLGMRLLRAAAYACGRRRAAGLEFVRRSQCDDGSFGDYDTALARLRARGDRNAPLRVKLPVTLQALWTLAELESPRFRLVRSALMDRGEPPSHLRNDALRADPGAP
ncbi:MAG TPA: hypothetical protein VHG08_10925 [Longimicrobium sp.]|nr:hypothetical protein [Longimicrobium sp.]